MVLWQRELGLCKTVTGPVRCLLAYEELRLKEFERNREGSWVDEIPDGNDRSIDVARHVVMDDVLGGVKILGWSNSEYSLSI